MIGETFQALLNKAPSKGGNEEQREWTQSQKCKNPKSLTKGQRNKLCSKTFTSHKKHMKEVRGRKPERAASLEEPSPATTASFKIETTCALCIATTLSTYERHNYLRLLVPFANHVILTHR
jgi:hypothetical protein